MGNMRKQFSKEFKAKVAFESLKGLKTTAELGSEFAVHPTQITKWKNELKEGLVDIFSRGKGPDEKDKEQLIEELYKQIGRLQMENDWLKKKLPF